MPLSAFSWFRLEHDGIALDVNFLDQEGCHFTGMLSSLAYHHVKERGEELPTPKHGQRKSVGVVRSNQRACDGSIVGASQKPFGSVGRVADDRLRALTKGLRDATVAMQARCDYLASASGLNLKSGPPCMRQAKRASINKHSAVQKGAAMAPATRRTGRCCGGPPRLPRATVQEQTAALCCKLGLLNAWMCFVLECVRI